MHVVLKKEKTLDAFTARNSQGVDLKMRGPKILLLSGFSISFINLFS